MKTHFLQLLLCMLTGLATLHAQNGTTNTLPVVSLRIPAQASISESGLTNAVSVARETTNVTASLTVYYSITGGASNGVDYVELPGAVVIPAGLHNVAIPLIAINDSIPEHTENIVLTIRPSETYRTNIGFYKVTSPVIDNDNAIPTVHLFSPTNNSVFFGPTNILLRAEAHDSDGSLRKVEFYRNNLLIGSVTNSGSALYQLTWNNAQPGTYSLVAKAVDNLEARGSSVPVNIVIHQNTIPTNVLPSVHIVAPTNNSVFTAPAQVSISAHASDPDGFVKTVEFLAGTNSLAIVTNYPGTTLASNLFAYTWSQVPAGEYAVRAKATDNSGAFRLSESIFIKVTPAPAVRPIVTVATTDPEASEGANIATVLNTATFTISRRENTNVALTVHFRMSGTASNGLDYLSIPGSVHLPSGKVSTNIVIRPIDDNLSEENETVSITVLPPVCIQTVFPLPPECYMVGEQNHASAVIIDNDRITNLPPIVQLLSPTNNSVFVGPVNIPIEATASDPDSQIARVDFFAGDHFLGSQTNSPYVFVWKNAMPGSYLVKAKATDDKGVYRFSEPSKITVHSLSETAFVRRSLPLWYVPGVKVRVHLRAEPRTNTVSYIVHDSPPEGWTIQTIEQGTVDSGRITFGPFNDAKPRTFVYDVISAGSGEKRFKGEATANTISSSVIGATVMVSAPPHPADVDDARWSFSALEVEKYALAWKHCERWPIAPNPIPVNYVTRAGFLFADADHYRLSNQFPTPVAPLLWVSAQIGTATLHSPEEPWVTNRLASAVSSVPTNYIVGAPFTVSIAVTPGAGVKAYALEETPPIGFSVTNVTGAGVFCRETRKIRWGLFSDLEPRTLSYQLVALTNSPSIARFNGVVSCNGINQPVTGQRETRRATHLTAAKLDGVKTLSDGNRLLTFSGEPGIDYVLEASSDLLDWQPIAELLNSDGNLQFIDPSTNEVIKFYRALPRE